MPSNRRWWIVLFAVALLVVACGGGQPESSSTPTGEDQHTHDEGAESTDGHDHEHEEGEHDHEHEEEGGNDSSSSDSRSVTHEMGTEEISGTPSRVVALEWRYVEDLLALGIQPVGVADVDGYRKVSTTEPALGEEVTDVGTRQEPNLEAIAALEPDLIIGARFRHETIYEQLQAIAPTLLYNYTDVPEDGPTQFDYMVEELQEIAKALNRVDEAEARITEMNEAFEEQKSRLEAVGRAGEPVALAQFLTGSPELRLWTDHSIAIQALEKAGLVNAWEGEFERFGFNVAEYESLPSLDDANVFNIRPPGNPEENPHFAQLQQSSVWQELSFVQKERFAHIDGVWPFGGPLSLVHFTEQVVTIMVGGAGNSASTESDS